MICCFVSARAIASAGWACRELSGPAVCPFAPIRAMTCHPSASARAEVVSTRAAAPSEIWEELPAVIVPSFAKAGRRRARDSAVVSGRMPSSAVTSTDSPRRCGAETGTISSASSSAAAAAR